MSIIAIDEIFLLFIFSFTMIVVVSVHPLLGNPSSSLFVRLLSVYIFFSLFFVVVIARGHFRRCSIHLAFLSLDFPHLLFHLSHLSFLFALVVWMMMSLLFFLHLFLFLLLFLLSLLLFFSLFFQLLLFSKDFVRLLLFRLVLFFFFPQLFDGFLQSNNFFLRFFFRVFHLLRVFVSLLSNANLEISNLFSQRFHRPHTVFRTRIFAVFFRVEFFIRTVATIANVVVHEGAFDQFRSRAEILTVKAVRVYRVTARVRARFVRAVFAAVAKVVVYFCKIDDCFPVVAREFFFIVIVIKGVFVLEKRVDA